MLLSHLLSPQQQRGSVTSGWITGPAQLPHHSSEKLQDMRDIYAKGAPRKQDEKIFFYPWGRRNNQTRSEAKPKQPTVLEATRCF